MAQKRKLLATAGNADCGNPTLQSHQDPVLTEQLPQHASRSPAEWTTHSCGEQGTRDEVHWPRSHSAQSCLRLIGRNYPHDLTQPPGGGTAPFFIRFGSCRKRAFEFFNISRLGSHFGARAGLQLSSLPLFPESGVPGLQHHTC